jgi:hypothetical protein
MTFTALTRPGSWNWEAALAPVPMAAADKVKVVPEMAVMVVPGATLGPLTPMPTARPVLLFTVADVEPFVVVRFLLYAEPKVVSTLAAVPVAGAEIVNSVRGLVVERAVMVAPSGMLGLIPVGSRIIPTKKPAVSATVTMLDAFVVLMLTRARKGSATVMFMRPSPTFWKLATVPITAPVLLKMLPIGLDKVSTPVPNEANQ